MTRTRFALALTTLAMLVIAGFTVPAQAATEVTYGPTRITGIPVSPTKIVPLRTIELAMTAGQTTYVYSRMNAYDADQVTLVDNEVRCSGAGGSNVVMGENIDPKDSANVERRNITIVTRFLVSATVTGTMTCKLIYRGVSLFPALSAVTVAGEFRFVEPASIGEDASGLAMQTSLPNGNVPVTSTTRTPVLDRTLTSGQTKVDVIADVEYMSCDPGECEHSSTTSRTKFTLFVNQLNGDTVCASAVPAQTTVAVNRQTHHKAVPLYAHLDLAPGCRRLHAYVKAEYVDGPAGSIQGRADGLEDEDGSGTHNSVMTHIFAVPS